MTKIVIQIPCFDEAESLPVTLGELPRHLPGADTVEWLVVDDGSRDGTADVARREGADHVVVLPRNRGLARAFTTGLEASLRAGADVVVNTDADNQYRAADIAALVAPILEGRADLVVGARPIEEVEHFSRAKKVLQRAGSWVVRRVSGVDVPDAASGFRAFSRDAARQIKVFNDFSHTLETLVQAGAKGMAVAWVPVRTNPQLRPSRLFRSNWGFIGRQGLVLLRIYMTYRPFAFFAVPGGLSFFGGFVVGARFLWFFWTGNGAGHVQSLILAALLMGSGLLLVIVGLVADLISVNRKLLEGVDGRLRAVEEEVREASRSSARAADESEW